MAKKIVKKATPVAKPVAKAAPVKKAVASKPAVKSSAKPVVKPAVAGKPAAAPAPVMASSECGCPCGCKCGGFGRFMKKLIIFIVIFALGFMAAKYCDHGKGMFKRGHGDMEFVNGCLDVTKIKCPEMAQKIMAADTNADGCVSREELRAARESMRGDKPSCQMAR